MTDYFNILLHNPLFIIRSLHLGEFLAEKLPNTPCTHWVLIPYHLKNSRKISIDAALFHKYRPADNIYYFYHDIKAYMCLKNTGLQLINDPLEAMMDTDLFYIDSTINKTRDALMVARSQECKRISLARNVQNVTILTDYRSEQEHTYHQRLVRIYGNRLIRKRINKPSLNILYNESHVGLCLGSREGAQRTTLEHQLAGNPVVCTTSKGGRHKFINPETCMILPPDAQIIAHGVKEMIRRNHTPQQVRDSIMLTLMRYRNNIMNLGESIINKHGLTGFGAIAQSLISQHQTLSVYSTDVQADLDKLHVHESTI